LLASFCLKLNSLCPYCEMCPSHHPSAKASSSAEARAEHAAVDASEGIFRTPSKRRRGESIVNEDTATGSDTSGVTPALKKKLHF
jgi:hypothetical protein